MEVLMKKIYLSIVLLYAVSASTFIQATYNIHGDGQVINAPIINSLDGKFPIHMLLHFRSRITSLIEHNHTPNSATALTLHDLATYERACELKKSDAELAKAQVYLKRLIENVSEIAKTEPCFKYFHTMYAVLDQLVEEWAEQFEMRNGKFYLFIKSWKTLGTEHELLTNQIYSLQELESFLNELHKFLGDLTVSFPKSLAIHQNSTNA